MSMWQVLEFQFEVGKEERHEVGFRFNRSLGPLTISVDDEPVVKKFTPFSMTTTERYELSVGEQERHNVVIEKSRQGFLGGFQDQVCVAYVDDEFVGRYTG
ncbi:MAG TPA: hypothetical protein VHD39_01760 [Acidimicrobiales bacterium]|nr:hypothetical protein [Acidimicrobiales bacterium]